VVLTFYGLCSIAAIFSLIMSTHRFERLVLLVFCVITWIGIARLGYVEFHVARRMFMEGAFRRQLSSRILLQHYESTLNSASTPQECWNVIENASRELGFQRVSLSLAGEGYEYRAESNMEDCWELHVPLSEADYIDLSGPFDEMRQMGSIAPFADMLRRRIPLIASTFSQTDRKQRYRIVSRSS
jgi:hypothetical protein